MKNWKKKIVIGITALCIASGSVFLVMASDDTKLYVTNAENEQVQVGHYEEFTSTDVKALRDVDGVDGNHQAPTAAITTNEAQDDKVFAGWYSDSSCTSEYALTDEKIDEMINSNDADVKFYAKFVSDDILNIKAQLLGGTDSTYDVTTLRFVTTVDSLDYEIVGFTLKYTGSSGQSVTDPVESKTVYSSLYYVGNSNGDVMSYKPTEFHGASKYFMAVNLTGIPKGSFETNFAAIPYWVTCDGTKVENTSVDGKTVKQGILSVCEALVTSDSASEGMYYSTLEKAFAVKEDTTEHTYLSDGAIVTIIQNKVVLGSTLTVYTPVILTNEEGRDVVVKRTSSGRFIDNCVNGLIVIGAENDNKEGSLTFDGTGFTNNYGCIESDANSDIQLTLNNINIQNITSKRDGGAIRSTGKTTIIGCSFENITQSGSNGGGAIYQISDGLEITGCKFSSITASCDGGAIYVKAGTLTVDDSDFDTNTANGSEGGSIYLAKGTATISGSDFKSNSSTNGGAIYVGGENVVATIQKNCNFEGNNATNGGAICAAYGTTIIKDNCQFSLNMATNGGAVYLTQTVTENEETGETTVVGNPKVSITASTFTENNAVTGGAIYQNSGTLTTVTSQFGGEKTENEATLSLGNKATDNGGAIYIVAGQYSDTDSTFTRNEGSQGGAIRVQNASDSVTFNSTKFTNNISKNNGGAINAQRKITLNSCEFTLNEAEGADGGGAVLAFRGVTDNGSKYTANEATNNGGGVTVAGNTYSTEGSVFEGNRAASGAAVYIKNEATFDDDNSTYKENVAKGNGGAILVANGAKLDSYNSEFSLNTGYHGGAIRINDGAELVTIEKATFRGNYTDETEEKEYNGGAINAQESVTVIDSLFDDNSATYGVGGAICVTAPDPETEGEENVSELTVSGSTFVSNRSVSGGAVGVANNGVFTAKGSTFGGTEVSQGNTATTGGAIYVNGVNATTQEGCQFINNTATNYGGAIYTVTSLNESGSTFTLNRATRGGAIEVDNGTATIEGGSTFTSNSATTGNGGGAIYVRTTSGDNVVIKTANFNLNTATKAGGAIYKNAGTVTVRDNCTFDKNEAGTNGGAIYNVKATFNITNSSLTRNQASAGGAVYSAAGTLSIKESTFGGMKTEEEGTEISLGNTATGNGGAVCIKEGSFVDTNSTFINNTGNHGGAVRIEAGITSVSIDGSIFTGNYTTKANKGYNGGAINIQAATKEIKITNVTFQENIAAYRGAGIYSAATNLTVDGCTFNGNTHAKNGDTLIYSSAEYAGAYSTQAVGFTNTTLINQATTDFNSNITITTQATANVTTSAVANILDAGNGHQMSLLTNMEEDEYEVYCTNVVAMGYDEYAANTMNNNLFRTYKTTAGDMLHTYWIAHSKEVRTITAKTNLLPVKAYT